MIAISLSFPAGRYHATPRGRHVNEGAVEWPPSPWRLLRSLVAVWKRTLPDVPESDMKPIFEALAATPPRFVLPPASTGHTRHYMPLWPIRPDKKKHADIIAQAARVGIPEKLIRIKNPTLVFDAFIALDPTQAAVLAIWPDAALTDTQRNLLDRLLANLNYLGRAESWCEARLLTNDQADAALEDGEVMHAVPLDAASDSESRSDTELVRTLCADPDNAFKNDRFTEQRQRKQGKKTLTETIRTAAPYDPDWHLTAETLWVNDQKWSDPPGSRWVTYARPRDCFEIKPAPSKAFASRRRAARDDAPICIARFALDSPVLPLITDTLPVAEAARRALMSIFGRQSETNGVRGRSPIFAGKDHLGAPLQGHRHAYFLPTDEDADGRLDHLTVYASGGFGPDELGALERLQRITWNSPHPLRAVLLHTSSLIHATAALIDPRAPLARSPLARSPVASSAVWASATPYLVTRHPKTRGPHKLDLADPDARARFLQDDLIAQLRSARPDLAEFIPDAIIKQVTDAHRRFSFSSAADAPRHFYALQFKRFRSKPSDDGGRRPAAAFVISFPSPVRGPLALGHSSHFGMGLFLPRLCS